MSSKNSEVVQAPAATAAAEAITAVSGPLTTVPLLQTSSHLQPQPLLSQLPTAAAAVASVSNQSKVKPKKFSELNMGEKVFPVINLIALIGCGANYFIRLIIAFITTRKEGIPLPELNAELINVVMASAMVTAIFVGVYLDRFVWMVIHLMLVAFFCIGLLFFGDSTVMLVFSSIYLLAFVACFRQPLLKELKWKRPPPPAVQNVGHFQV